MGLGIEDWVLAFGIRIGDLELRLGIGNWDIGLGIGIGIRIGVKD